jgi:tetrapyrrole methylase family protein/MazG family protein
VEVVRQICDKMVRRHPHVFGDVTAATTDEVKQHWNAAKSKEKSTRSSKLDGLPDALPQLARAGRIASRAASVGYDFPDRRMLFDKLFEELREFSQELFESDDFPVVAAGIEGPVVPDQHIECQDQRSRVESELGDVLFVLANIARRWGINAEEALRKSNAKFARRFKAIESASADAGTTMEQASLAEMEAAYQAAKAREKASEQ